MPHRRRIITLILLALTAGSVSITAPAQERQPDVYFVGTPPEVVMEMLKTAQVTKDDLVYDLGCGDGRIVITAAKEFGARGVGVDIDPARIKESRENAIKEGVADRVTFLQQDLFKTDISRATVVTLYLLTELNLRIRPKLLQELKPGTRIVSHEFSMGDWTPDKTGKVPNVRIYYQPNMPHEKDSYFYFWVVPADVAGQWRWTVPASTGNRNYTLRLNQTFQEISGKINLNGRDRSMEDARSVGDQMSFTLRETIKKQRTVMRFSGRISGDTITGHVEVRGGPFAGRHNWTATRSR